MTTPVGDKELEKIDNLSCKPESPCYCYGSICLKLPSKDAECNSGQVYQSGKPVCNNEFSEKGGNVICNSLGFYGIQDHKTITASNHNG